MTNFFDLTGLGGDDFWAELDREYYKANPEEWDKNDAEFFIKGEDYTAAIEGKKNNHTRERQPGEIVTSHFIKRDGYYVWKVGREYIVKHHDSEMRQVDLSSQDRDSDKVSESYRIGINQDNIIGKLRLIYIKVGMQSDELVFEKIDE